MRFSLLRVPEGRDASLSLRYLLSLADDEVDGNNIRVNRGVRSQRWRQFHIISPWYDKNNKNNDNYDSDNNEAIVYLVLLTKYRGGGGL